MAITCFPSRISSSTSNTCEISNIAPKGHALRHFPIDTFAFVDVLYIVFVLADSFYRACFLAWNRNIYDSMVRTALVTDTATDTIVSVAVSVFMSKILKTGVNP